ncbi:hypothetical protein cyc_00860 [Cyclospora cayetanensis]|uniref:Uncharacterized protein n=1 Tax=Cyclospora cayetanensis TaxID=88456 RepID=A0A1D3CUQ1_9EIME|nr:hypothetical protein cyc_00860 [Cyclospora cayetanensis]
MAGAASTPSSEELQKQLDSAAQTVDFSHVSGSETPDTAEIRVPPNSTVAVRLSCVGGYRGFLLSGHSGLLALTDVPHKSLTAEEARNLLQEEPSLPSGIKATQPVPFAGSQGSGLGIVGAPVPFLGIVHAETPVPSVVFLLKYCTALCIVFLAPECLRGLPGVELRQGPEHDRLEGDQAGGSWGGFLYLRPFYAQVEEAKAEDAYDPGIVQQAWRGSGVGAPYTVCSLLTMRQLLSSLLGASCALALCSAAAGSETESPVPVLSEVSAEGGETEEEDFGVYLKFEGDDVVVSLPPGMAGFGLEEQEQGFLMEPAEEGEEGAIKRELCSGYKCVKIQPRTGKTYKKKKHHYKKHKKYVVPQKAVAVPVPRKEPEPEPEPEIVQFVQQPTKQYLRAPCFAASTTTTTTAPLPCAQPPVTKTIDTSNMIQRYMVKPTYIMEPVQPSYNKGY